ncbi:MAG: hypothetical protein A3E37_01475 [Candidatus Andersenbacteria bacterium RIFCSPHIGHO2_12_FULL_46_9]|nr:MAG: hypothetical protein A3E37_01475 [Candidatus Andersenbacteria bacterium RIFCSPHIGHO2_12_FULL_46_9]OGY35948.1 MAG: hypothetical protein A3B76_04205 [Candidatus Andersenbacteria bacterium RIFCSPHIGHO2_02_FULL_46_16]OGY39005.1 MAG: hypothetical protein A3G57_03780 [Candidatus Andersenbacteria bacterium RIFCSPLOWO2_12_FULL_45_8]
MYRKYPIDSGEVYHVMNKSIAGFKIFNSVQDYNRMMQLIRFFSLPKPPAKFSLFINRDIRVRQIGFESTVVEISQTQNSSIRLLSYCLMPTHFHLLVQQLTPSGLTNLLRKTLDGYSHYFNTKYKRLGPLWTGPFKNVLIEDDEQLLHVTRYIHLNPTTAGLVKKPEDWPYSSYREYITPDEVEHPLTNRAGIIDMKASEYKAFVNNQKTYQRELAVIKKQILE